MVKSYETWWAQLAEDDRALASTLRGHPLPDHLCGSLRAASVELVNAELVDGDGLRAVWLMPALLADFIEFHSH